MASKKKTAQARIEETLRADFDWALEVTGMGETQFIEAAIKALVDHVRQEGGIWLPLAIVPKTKGKSFSEVGETSNARAGGLSSDITRASRVVLPEGGGEPRLSETPGVQKHSTGRKPRSPRSGTTKAVERKPGGKS